MTDAVVLSPNRAVESKPVTSAIAHGAASDGWVVPAGEANYSVTVTHDGFNNTTLNGFDITTATDSLTVTIDTGEAYIGGSWCARNTTTDVTLTASTTSTIYIGYSIEQPNDLIVGLDGAFDAEPAVRRLTLFTVTTDDVGVPSGNTTDERPLGRHIDALNATYDSDLSGVVDEAETAQSATTADNASFADLAGDADALGGAAASAYAQRSQDETIPGAWTHEGTLTLDSQGTSTALHVQGANATDSNEVVIDGDADSGQDDDLLKVRSVLDPRNDPVSDSDSVFVTKGDGRVGINKYDPEKALDVSGDAAVAGQLLVDRGGQQVVVRESDTNTDWYVEAQAGGFRIVEAGVEEWFEIDTTQHGRIEAPGGMATQQLRLTPQSGEPTSPQNGELAVQDGNNWNPAGTGELDLVVYLGGVWERCSQ